MPTKGLHTVTVEAAAVPATTKRVVTKTVATKSVKSVTAKTVATKSVKSVTAKPMSRPKPWPPKPWPALARGIALAVASKMVNAIAKRCFVCFMTMTDQASANVE